MFKTQEENSKLYTVLESDKTHEQEIGEIETGKVQSPEVSKNTQRESTSLKRVSILVP